jgi:ubiquinone/menaquinone biosynthesis C-methylase UbiE
MAGNPDQITRVTRPREAAKAAYNGMSKWYDVFAGPWEKKYREEGVRKLAVREGEKVLEIGFGTGHCIQSIAQSVGDSGKVYGMDISEGMLAMTRDRVQRAGLSGRVELVLGDAVSLPFEAGFFDAVFMSFTLELFDTPDIPLVLAECMRVVKVGGRLCVVASSKEGKERKLAVRFYEWAHQKLPARVDCRPIFPQRSLVEAGFHLHGVSPVSRCGLTGEIVLAVKPPRGGSL